MSVGKLLGLFLSVGNLQVLGFVGNLTGEGFLVGTLTFPREKNVRSPCSKGPSVSFQQQEQHGL